MGSRCLQHSNDQTEQPRIFFAFEGTGKSNQNQNQNQTQTQTQNLRHCSVLCRDTERHFSPPTFIVVFFLKQIKALKRRVVVRKRRGMGWVANQQCRRWKTSRICGAAFLCCVCFLLFTPRIPRSPKHHQFVDMRNLLGNHTLPHSTPNYR